MYGRKLMTAVLVVLAAGSVIALAGEGFVFKCQNKECGFNSDVLFGGGMMFERTMGWCHKCQAFKAVTWTRPGSPLVGPETKIVPEPKPLAEVWVSAIGQTRKVYKCPTCDGAFLEIRTAEELCCCPKCSKPGFKIDPDAPVMAVD